MTTKKEAIVQLNNTVHYSSQSTDSKKTCRKGVIRILTKCIEANTFMKWLRNDFQKHPICPEYQYSIRSQKYRNLYWLWLPFWENIIFCGDTTSPHCVIATIPCKGYHYFYNVLEKTKIGKDTILGSNVYTYIPQEEGTNVVCQA